jgi:hypothetical protein
MIVLEPFLKLSMVVLSTIRGKCACSGQKWSRFQDIYYLPPPETKSYARKNSHTASFAKTKCQTQHGKVMREKETVSFINDAAS